MLSGVSSLFLGGGISIDKEYRRPGIEHWETEDLTDEQTSAILEKPKCRLMFGHDSWWCPSPSSVKAIHPQEILFREKATKIYRYHSPEIACWGHYHTVAALPASTENPGLNFWLPGSTTNNTIGLVIQIKDQQVTHHQHDFGTWI